MILNTFFRRLYVTLELPLARGIPRLLVVINPINLVNPIKYTGNVLSSGVPTCRFDLRAADALYGHLSPSFCPRIVARLAL
jgi:hypothetical protein